MRSRSCTGEEQECGHIQPTKGFIMQEEEEQTPQLTKTRMKIPREDMSGKTSEPEKKSQKPKEGWKTKTSNLTKEDLVHLLGVMEGEVQAREDIIGLLKTEKTRPETLEAHYGFAAPTKPLQALQRDSQLFQGSSTEDVYEKPMAELDRLEDKQKETYRRMLEQLLLAEKCHRRTVMELDNEKRKHADFMDKSDDFTNLLEQERERLKLLLEQEKAYQARRDKEHNRRMEKVRAELVKLQSFALMLVEERQMHIDQIDQQSQTIQDLTQKLQDKEQQLTVATEAANEDCQKVLKLQAELERQRAKFAQEHEEMVVKLSDQESQSRQLRLTLAEKAREVEELEEGKRELQKSKTDLQEMREKISNGEGGNSSLVAELEGLRKKVLEMEGKDEEITKMETRCKELGRRLQAKENHSKELRFEVDKLQKKMVDLEKLEGSFNRSKTECKQLHANLEKERKNVKDLACELERVKAHLKELESSGAKLEKTEAALKDDLMKLKSFTVILVDERKNLAERLKQEEQNKNDLSKMFKEEQSKVTDVTEKLIEESKNLLKFKSEMEIQAKILTKEKEELKSKFASEEEKCQELKNSLKEMKLRIDGLEESKCAYMDKNRSPEDNKVKELMEEIERLKGRLKQLEVVEGDLMKTEDEYDLLEKKFRTEQDKACALSKLVEEMKVQINRNKAVEKGEVVSPEAELRSRCKMEEAKNRELRAEVQALKEKIHELMNKEDQLSQLQVDFSVLQRRFIEEEEKKKSMSQEVEDLIKELEATKLYSRAFRPSMNGRKMVDVPVTSTAVQTDVMTSNSPEDETTAGFIRKSVQEENHLMSNLRQQDLKKPSVLERYPPASADLGGRKSSLPWMKKKEATKINWASSLHPAESAQKQGQPLHIRVMPDHDSSKATLEITSPRAEDFFSTTTIIPTLGLQKPRITIVPKYSKPKGCDSQNRAMSPVTITAISRAKSPEQTSSYQSPVSIITVSATPVAEACVSSDPHETQTGRTAFKLTPERRGGTPPFRKYNDGSGSSIIMTEDNKIHIHLGPQLRQSSEGRPLLTLRPVGQNSDGKGEAAGVGLQQPVAVKTTQGKMTSSITITPITAAAVSKPTASAPSSDAQTARSAATRIPVSKCSKSCGKAVLGLSTVTRLESRAEAQAMKIELRKTTLCNSSSAAGGKS
ncbi:filamin-A-interacting protein 1 isoform X1 [Oryzias melastigma]|uniref:Filamin A interacting protein 1b n=2 Tax=Oryzias melastigma TaxID=30732 RepID=A0A3B3CRS0_ORYME|nr:filamin-A-interacting protein 1 isoform X1 [Oryzias melastigma]